MERKTLFKKENWRARSGILRNEDSECLTEEEWLTDEEETPREESLTEFLAATSLLDKVTQKGKSKKSSVVSGLVAKWDRRLMKWSPALDKVFLYGLDDGPRSSHQGVQEDPGGQESSKGGDGKELNRVFPENREVDLLNQPRIPSQDSPGGSRDSATGAVSKGH